MKTATIIFVALTVFSGLFLESSSAPSLLGNVLGGSGSQNILVGVGGLVKNIVVAVENLVEVVFDKLTKLLAGVDSEIKEAIEGILENFKTIVIKLLDATKNRDVGDIVKNFKLLDVAVGEIKTALAQLLEKFGDDAKIKNLEKEVNGIVTELVKLVKADLKQFVDETENGLLPELKKLVADLIKALDEALPGASGDVKELITKITEVLKKLIENIGEIIKAITTRALDKLERLFADCKSNIDVLKQLCVHAELPDVPKNILTKVIELVDVIFPKLEGIFEICKNPLFIVLGKEIQEVEALIQDLLVELQAGTTELGEPLIKLSEHVCNLFIALENGNIVDVQKLEVLIVNLIKKIKAIVVNLLEKLGDEAREVLDKVLQVVEKIFKKVLKALTPIVKELINGLKVIISNLKEVLAVILKKIKEALADAKGQLKVLLIKIKELLKELLEKLLDFIKAVVALVSNVTDESLNKVNGLGKEIEELLLKLVKIIGESEGGEGILGKELGGLIHEVVSIVNKVLIHAGVIVKIVVNP